MADFKQAIDWLNEGENIRRSVWPNNQYVKKIGKFICCQDDVEYFPELSIVFENDWELYEEKPKHICKSGMFDYEIGYSECREMDGKLMFYFTGILIGVTYCPFCGLKAGE